MSVEERAHLPSTPNVKPAPSSLVWLAGVVFVVSVAALVVLEAMGRPTLTLVALVTPVITGLLVSGHVSTVTREQNVAIDKIERQTNGVLDDRIRTQVKAALAEAAPVPVIPVAPLESDQALPSAPGEPPSTATMPARFIDDAREPRA